MEKGDSYLTKEVRNDLTSLQYENGNELNIETIEEIFISNGVEGIKKEDLTLFKSDGTNINKPVGTESGFDGAAIYIKTNEVDEVYYIYRGTELDNSKFEDIMYNLLGIVGGTATDQLDDALDFYEEVEKEITNGENGEIIRHGDGHSLGGHLIINTALIKKDFTDVRGINDAPTNMKLLVKSDWKFDEHVRNATGENPLLISEKKLQSFAQDFYSEEIKNITHERMKGEPLYAQEIPYTAYMGHKINYYGDPNTSEFPNVFEANHQLGIFYDLANPLSLRSSLGEYYFVMDGMVYLAGVAGERYTVSEASEFVDSAVTSSQKVLAMMPDHMKKTLGTTALVGAGVVTKQNPLLAAKGLDIYTSMDQMDLHSIAAFNEAYKESNVPIIVEVIEPGTGDRIVVDIDALLEVRNTLMLALDEKHQALDTLQRYINTDVLFTAYLHELEIRRAMDDKEANWRSFLAEEGKTYKEKDVYKPTGVNFRREVDPIDEGIYQPLHDLIEVYQEDIKELEKISSSFEENLETLFEVDEEISQKLSS